MQVNNRDFFSVFLLYDTTEEFIINLFIHFFYALHELGNADAPFRTTN